MSRSRGTGTDTAILLRTGWPPRASVSAARSAGCRSKAAVSMPKAAIALALRQHQVAVRIQLQQRVRQAFHQGAVLRRAADDPRPRSCSACTRRIASSPSARIPGTSSAVSAAAAHRRHCHAKRGPDRVSVDTSRPSNAPNPAATTVHKAQPIRPGSQFSSPNATSSPKTSVGSAPSARKLAKVAGQARSSCPHPSADRRGQLRGAGRRWSASRAPPGTPPARAAPGRPAPAPACRQCR